MLFVFLFKQKTAYEMRISDWSSDVCSSDLGGYHFERLWRGVTDHHIVEASFIVSAEARKLHGLAAEQADSYTAAAKLVRASAAAAEASDDDDEGAREGEGIPGGAATSLRTGKGESLVARPSQLLDEIGRAHV